MISPGRWTDERKRAACLGLFLIGLACLAAPVLAQSPFGVGPGAPPPASPPTGPVAWLLAQQAAFYRALTSAIGAAKADGSAVFGLIGLAFAYGLFHAAGPGHGKAVISSYVVADGRTLRSGVLLAFLAAAIQALAALAIVAVLVVLFQGGARQIDGTVAVVETASYGLILGLGLWLMWRKGRALRAAFADPSPAHAHHHHHAHGDDHSKSCDDPHCGHAHMPEAAQVAAMSNGQFLATAVAAGIRPCTGAIIVMVFAIAQGMFLAGAAAVGAMAVGTALITSLFAALAVGFKHTALSLASGGQGAGLIVRLLEFVAALFIAILGAALLAGYWASGG